MKSFNQCLGCYAPLERQEISEIYHERCSRKLFGTAIPPTIDFGIDELEDMAKTSISYHLALTGVQKKISLEIQKQSEDPSHRMMIVGLWGNFILKPPTTKFPEIAKLEDVTMHMARAAGIATAEHGLIPLKTGELAYITRRFDRLPKKQKVAMEDFCQLSEMLSADKYNTSTEMSGKIIWKYSSSPGLDALRFFEMNIFSFLTGNADMHLKNYSLIQNDLGQYELSPAYDLLSTKLLLPEDKEESALSINGKKIKLKKLDFDVLGKNLKISEKSMEHSFSRILKSLPIMEKLIETSFISSSTKKSYIQLLQQRAKRLELAKISARG